MTQCPDPWHETCFIFEEKERGMELRDDVKAEDILQSISNIISSPTGLANEQPAVLSCGGIYLRGRQVPKSMSSWKTQIFLPNAIRVFRLRGETSSSSLKRILDLESLN